MNLTREDIEKYGTEAEKSFLKRVDPSFLENSIKSLSVAVDNKNWRAAEVWLKDLLAKVQDLKGRRYEG